MLLPLGSSLLLDTRTSHRPTPLVPQVRQLGFMYSKFLAETGGVSPAFRTGAFRLAVRWIKAI